MKTSRSVLSVLSTLVLASQASGATRTVVAQTSLQDEACVLVDADILHEDAEIDYFISECPGMAGFRVNHNGGDLRSHIELIRSGVKSNLSVAPAGFAYVSSQSISWAFQIVDNKKSTPVGVRFQVSGQDLSDENPDAASDVTFDIIASIKGDKACVVSVERAGANTNDAAHERLKIANTLKCL